MNKGRNPVVDFRAGEYAVRVLPNNDEFEPDCDANDHIWGTHYVTHYRYKWRVACEVLMIGLHHEKLRRKAESA